MPSDISGYLEDIRNATYGEQVRSAIYNAISTCYTNVQSGVTTAGAAASSAYDAADSALTAAASARSAASSVVSAIASVESSAKAAISRAESSATSAIAAAQSEFETALNELGAATEAASVAASNASAASIAASAAALRANTAAAAAENAANSVATEISNLSILKSQTEAARDSANSAATSLATIISDATAATTNANAAASSAYAARDAANEAAANAVSATSDYQRYKNEVATAINQASSATSRANSAASALEAMSVSYESVGPDGEATATISKVNDHYNIHFKLKQGATGSKMGVMATYATLEALTENVTSPKIGDLYNVGTTAPYDMYLWAWNPTSGQYEWVYQGPFGIDPVSSLTNSDVDTLWDETAISDSGSKFLDQNSLLYFITNKIKAAINTLTSSLTGKVDKVDGKGLSTNDFTDHYIEQVDYNAAAVEMLTNNKVDKVDGKGLSANDFTNAYKTKLDGIDAGTSLPLMDAVSASAGSSSAYARADHVHPRDRNRILYFATQSISVASSSAGEVCRITDSRITSNSAVVAARIARPDYVCSDLSWTSSSGYISFVGVTTASTNMDVTILNTP